MSDWHDWTIAELIERLDAAIAQREEQASFAFEMRRERDAMRAERDRLAACVERVRGIGVSVRECAPRANDGQMELWLAQIAADILTALEES